MSTHATLLQQHARVFSGPPPCPCPPPCSEAGFQEVRLSPGLQNLLASPILPRGWWNQQLLLALKQVRLCPKLAIKLHCLRLA